MDANRLRSIFIDYFSERGHSVVPSSSLIPHDASILFTIAGMVPFKPYFVGEVPAPWSRATSVQKCFRTPDIDLVGTTLRHCTFFEMLGNFSFGDYFKAEAISFAWELLTEKLGIESDRLWVTVHHSDDEAERLWRESTDVPIERIQRLGDDNFWSMGEVGPCGPSSEIYFDRGKSFGEDGGPAHGGQERFVEIWNLVFMEFNRLVDGDLVDLPIKCIDTGAGLERILPIVAGKGSMFDTDLFTPLIECAQSLTNKRYGVDDHIDIALRLLSDHARAVTMLIADGVVPSNESRGYVLRRLIRRAIVKARRLGVKGAVTSRLADATAEIFSAAYPSLVASMDLVHSVLEREESAFDRTLNQGLELFEDAIANLTPKTTLDIDAVAVDNKTFPSGETSSDSTDQLGMKRPILPGDVAFLLHDTHGFPLELTQELADDAGIEVDREGFERAMSAQRSRARESTRRVLSGDEKEYRSLLDEFGETKFERTIGPESTLSAHIVGLIEAKERGTTEIFLDRTPFYAEGGGQLGDTGVIVSDTGRATILDTVSVLPMLSAHRATIDGELFVGQEVLATIDIKRRHALQRNHTCTHLLHSALRAVLGAQVRQQGSLVAPERLRFDFSHHRALSRDEIVQVMKLVNEEILSDAKVDTTETSLQEAQDMGAVAFFGDKYGARVRVVGAGPNSLELCGGTHVERLGMIGQMVVVSETSIGSNVRRIEALTGMAALDHALDGDHMINGVAELLRSEPPGLIEAAERVVERLRLAEKELQDLRRNTIKAEAHGFANQEVKGAVVARVDGRSPDELRELAQEILGAAQVENVVIAGTPDTKKVSIVVSTTTDLDAREIVNELSKIVGGGGGGTPRLATAGGRSTESIDMALVKARQILGIE